MSHTVDDPILDSIADGVFTVDQNFRITSFNRAAEDITGHSKEEAIGQTCSAIFKTNICQRECALHRTIATKEKLVNVQVEIKNKNGVHVPVSISTAVLYDRQGQPIGGVETFRDLTALNELRREIDERDSLGEIIGAHPKMKAILDIVPEVARSEATALILGPSGSGKGLLARTMHRLSTRSDKSFVKVNCAALPDTLLESELFGYQKGAFTDAKQDKPGRIAMAEGGTLFLDEIGDVTPAVQVKLLRVVQEREYEALGSSTTRHANIRIIAATNRDLPKLIQQGAFREDLFYRLNVISFDLPPLAERREDIPRLVDRVLTRMNQKMGKQVEGFSESAMALLVSHDYPGNVRELENAIEHALVLCRGSVIEDAHLPTTLQQVSKPQLPNVAQNPLKSTEAQTIRETLEMHGGDRLKTAKALGLHRTTLWRKMRRYGLQ